jgi:hypothetical protein
MTISADQVGRFGVSRKRRPTFTVNGITLWWDESIDRKSLDLRIGKQLTVAEFLVFIDEHKIRLPDRHHIDPVAAAEKRARDSSPEAIADKKYWQRRWAIAKQRQRAFDFDEGWAALQDRMDEGE